MERRGLAINLFSYEITDWVSWANIFQSIEAFEPLIREICRREGFSDSLSITSLTPGTNAVFRLEHLIIKLFVPKESGLDTQRDYQSEQFGINHAKQQGVLTPHILAAGEIQDRYLFRYFIMEYLPGISAKEFLKTANRKQQQHFLNEIKILCKKLNQPVAPQPFLKFNFCQELKQSERWKPFPHSLHQQVIEQVSRMVFPPSSLVYVHGDLNEDNLLITPKNQLACIDFADNKLAPTDYELPPILFSLFAFQRDLIKSYQADQPTSPFSHRILQALLIHDFGGDFIKQICHRILKISPTQLYELQQLENGLKQFLL